MAEPTNAAPSTQSNPDDEREARRPMDEAERQAWRERGEREWAAEAPDRAAMALVVAVAGCEAALNHAEACALRLFDDAALDPFATLRELAEGEEGPRGATPDPEARREKDRLFATAHALLEARRDELAVAAERRYDPRTILSNDLQTAEGWEFHVSLQKDGRQLDREQLHEFRFGESRQLLRQAQAFIEAAASRF
jgi:hypothetical protein